MKQKVTCTIQHLSLSSIVCKLRKYDWVQQYLHISVDYTAAWRLWEQTILRLVPHQPCQCCCDLSVIHWNELSSLMETLGYECTQPVDITTTVKLPPIKRIIFRCTL